MKTALALGLVLLAYALAGCTGSRGELGSEKNPVKLYFVPSVDTKLIEDHSKKFKIFLEKNTPYKFEVSIPQSFIAVVEAFGTKRADVAALNTYGYALAHKKYGAEARLTVLRHGSPTYQSQFIIRADSKITKVEDLEGKKIAFVDPASSTGYLVPLKTLKDKKIKPQETVFAMKHDSVVSMVYQGQVDAGATYYSPPTEDGIEDARRLVKTQYPDVEKKVKILKLSHPIPNDPIVFRKDLPEEVKIKITQAFKDFLKTEEGKTAFNEVYGVTELKDATDADYAATLNLFEDLGVNLNEMASDKK